MIKNNIQAALLSTVIILTTLTTTKYIGFLLIIVILFIDLENTTTKAFKRILIFSTFLFYLKLYILSASEKFNSLWVNSLGLNDDIRFGDLQIVLTQIKCNYFNGLEDFSYKLKFSEYELVCPVNAGYGPLLSFFSIDLNIWIVTVVSSFLFFALFVYILFFNIEYANSFVLYILFLCSPPVLLVFSRMNIDLIIIPIIYLVFKNYGVNSMKTLTILIVTSLLKIYPIILFFLIIFLKIVSKKFNFFLYYLFSLFFIIIIFINGPSLLTSSPIRPSQSNIAFGFLTNSQEIWIKLFDRYGGFRYVLLIYASLLLIVLILCYFVSKKNYFIFSMEDNDFLLISFFLCIYLYANYDQRTILLFFVLIPFINFKNQILIKVILIYLCLSPLPEFQNLLLLNFLTVVKVFVSYICISILTVNVLRHTYLNYISNYLKKT